MVIVALHGDDPGTTDGRPQNLALFQAVGDEYVGLQARGRGVGRDASRKVAGRCTANGLEAKLDRLGQGHGHDAILERERRMVDGVVLEIELSDSQHAGQAVGPDQRSASHVPAYRGLTVNGQQLTVAPHGSRPRGKRRTSQRPRGGLVIIGDFQRAEILGAEVQGFLGIALAA